MMNYKYKKKRSRCFLLVAIIFALTLQCNAKIQASDDFDFAYLYPISAMQSVRYNLSQALYYSQHHDYESVVSLLQDTLQQLNVRQPLQEEDREYLQQMIDQINALIHELEQTDKSVVVLDLCQQLHEKL